MKNNKSLSTEKKKKKKSFGKIQNVLSGLKMMHANRKKKKMFSHHVYKINREFQKIYTRV